MATNIANHFIAIDVRIQWVEDVARVDVEPTHIFIGSHSGHDADAGAIVVVPTNRRKSFCHLVEIEHHGQIHENCMISSDHEVMHHRAGWNSDVCRVHQLTIAVKHVIGQEWSDC